jgi:hypothetical protein
MFRSRQTARRPRLCSACIARFEERGAAEVGEASVSCETLVNVM